jgi:hypothetical protein
MGFPRKEGMVDIDVEIDNAVISVDIDLDNDSVAIGGVKSDGTRILYKAIDDGTGKGLFPTVGTPTGTVTTSADVPVGIGATVPLPAAPAGTKRMRVQNIGPAGSFLRIKRSGEAAGVGIVLARFGVSEYGGADGAIATLAAEDVSLAFGGLAVAGVAVVQFEG